MNDLVSISRGKITHVKGLTKGIFLTAERFKGERFLAEVRDLRSALDAFRPGSERDEAVRLADTYLSGQPLQ